MSLELSLFCDDSGSDALDSHHYLLTLVIHDQSDSITGSITRYERALANKGLPDLAFHVSPKQPIISAPWNSPYIKVRSPQNDAHRREILWRLANVQEGHTALTFKLYQIHCALDHIQETL